MHSVSSWKCQRSTVPLSTRYSIWCSDVVFRSIKCLHPYSSPLAVFFKTLRHLVLFPSQLWFMLSQRGLRQPTEVTLRGAVIIRMIKKPRWACDAIPVCRIALLQVEGSGRSWRFCPGTWRMAEPLVRRQKQKEQAGMVVPVEFSLSNECKRRFRKAKISTCINGKQLNKCSADIA